MSDMLKPRDGKDVEAAVQWALAQGKALEIVGQGTKRAIGRPAQTDITLDLSGLTGVTLYEPEELVLSARAGTPIAEIEALVASRGQQLAFEPMDYGAILGGGTGGGTVGGALAANLSGPRRLKAGAARDHFLGVTAVSGRGETFKSGGRVVKNVTGYDLCKLLAGSWGTLAVMTDVTLKTLPRPETEATVLVRGLDPARAVEAMAAAMGSSCDVSGAAHLPAHVAGIMPVGGRPGGVVGNHRAAAGGRRALGGAPPGGHRDAAAAVWAGHDPGRSGLARAVAGGSRCEAVCGWRGRFAIALAHFHGAEPWRRFGRVDCGRGGRAGALRLGGRAGLARARCFR